MSDVAPIDYGRKSLTDYAYPYGALLFRELYTIIGRDEFMNAFKALYAKHRQNGLTADGFVGHFKRYTVIDLRVFWKEWLDSTAAIKRIVRTPC